MAELKLFCPFVVFFNRGLFDGPVVFDDLFLAFPRLYEGTGPNGEQYSKKTIESAVLGFLKAIQERVVRLKSEYEEPYHSRESEPRLIMYQKGKLKCILLSVVTLNEVH
jgi:hypothetical protein